MYAYIIMLVRLKLFHAFAPTCILLRTSGHHPILLHLGRQKDLMRILVISHLKLAVHVDRMDENHLPKRHTLTLVSMVYHDIINLSYQYS